MGKGLIPADFETWKAGGFCSVEPKRGVSKYGG